MTTIDDIRKLAEETQHKILYQPLQDAQQEIAELKQIIAESDEDHSETLQELERVMSFIYSALQVIDGASTDSSNLVKISAVRALLVSAAAGVQSQAVTS